MLTHQQFSLFLSHTHKHTPQQKQRNTKGSPNRSPDSQTSESPSHTHICYKYIWITSKVLAHPLAKRFSPINCTAHASADPHQFLVHPSFAPCQNITARKHASNLWATKKNNNVIPFRLGGQQNKLSRKELAETQLQCWQMWGALQRSFLYFTDLDTFHSKLWTVTLVNFYCDRVCQNSILAIYSQGRICTQNPWEQFVEMYGDEMLTHT